MTTETDIVDRLRRAYTRTGGNSVGDPYTSAIAAELAGLHARIDGQLVKAQGLVLEAERRAQDVIDRCEGDATPDPASTSPAAPRYGVEEIAAAMHDHAMRQIWAQNRFPGEPRLWADAEPDERGRALEIAGVVLSLIGSALPADERAAVCGDEIAEELDGLLHDPLSAGKHLLTRFTITRKD
jgi:hypothetical protein